RLINVAVVLAGVLHRMATDGERRRVPAFVAVDERPTVGRFRARASHNGTLRGFFAPLWDAWWPPEMRNRRAAAGSSATGYARRRAGGISPRSSASSSRSRSRALFSCSQRVGGAARSLHSASDRAQRSHVTFSRHSGLAGSEAKRTARAKSSSMRMPRMTLVLRYGGKLSRRAKPKHKSCLLDSRKRERWMPGSG